MAVWTLAAGPAAAQVPAGAPLAAGSAGEVADTTGAVPAAGRLGAAGLRMELARGQEENARPSALRPLAVAKWTALAGAVGAGAYGVLEARDADAAYRALEARCAGDEEACRARLPSGAYADPELEATYQGVVVRDRRAGRALLAGELGFAASVVLFVLDLRNAGPPETVPYEPRFRASRAEDGGLRLTVSLPAPGG